MEKYQDIYKELKKDKEILKEDLAQFKENVAKTEHRLKTISKLIEPFEAHFNTDGNVKTFDSKNPGAA